MEHAFDYPPSTDVLATPPRYWSYDALRHVRRWVPVDERGREDLSRIGAIDFPHYHAEHGLGWLSIHGPTLRGLGRWLYGLPGSFDSYRDRFPACTRKIDRVFEAFIEFDSQGRAWRHAALLPDDASPAQRRHARRRRREATTRIEVAKRRLQAALDYGLTWRVGERLEDADSTWLHFAARDFATPGVRVCEQCSVVFRARADARRCRRCRRRPVRISLRPLVDGGWHAGYRVGSRWATDEFDSTVTYLTVCRECGKRFETTRGDRRLCRNCGSPDGRVRRARGSRTRLARRVHRFVAASGEQLNSISANTANGEIRLEALDGVIATRDTEVARILEAMGTLRRLD